MASNTAVRGGEKRQFSTSIWETMPGNKYGWKQCADEPAEVTAAKMKLPAATTADDYAKQIADARKKVQLAEARYKTALSKGVESTIEKATTSLKEAEQALKQLLNAETD